MSEKYDEIMDKHFLNAGIDADAGNETTAATTEEKKPDATVEAGQDAGIDLSKSLPDEEGAKSSVDGAKPGTDNKDKQGSGVDGKPQQGKVEEGKDAGNPNDLKLADGSVVKAGAERRWYETARVAKQEVVQAKNETNTYKQQLEAIQAKNVAYEAAAKQVGVENPEDMQKAIRLYKDLRTDPQATMKQLLVDMKALGYTVDGMGPTIDTAAILAAIDQKLAPQTSVETKQEDAVANEVNSFFTAFPDARLHEGFIAEVVKANPNTSLSDAYLALKNGALENGFDWSKDLQPQIDAARAKRDAAPAAPAQEQKPMTPGSNLNGNNVLPHDPSTVFAQADSFEDAIRAGMRDAGMKIN